MLTHADHELIFRRAISYSDVFLRWQWPVVSNAGSLSEPISARFRCRSSYVTPLGQPQAARTEWAAHTF